MREDHFHIEAFEGVSSSLPRRHRKDIRVELSQTHRLAVQTLQGLHPRVDGAQMSGNDGIALPQDGQGAVCRRRRTLCRRRKQSATDSLHTMNSRMKSEIRSREQSVGWDTFFLLLQHVNFTTYSQQV